MKQKKRFILLLIVFVVLMAGAAALYSTLGDEAASDNMAQADNGERVPAPDFTVYDADGNAVKLSDFRGKPVVLNFWASWCGPCQMEMPAFDRVSSQLDGEVVFMMINATDGSRETVNSAKGFIEAKGYGFPVYYDTTYEASYTYGVSGLPTTFFIDGDGNAVGYTSGAISEDFLLQCIDLIRN